ncbi:MAG: prephenate dehydrogenase/arogenate dehydrogenase family protein, partial [Pseudomonadota bacterium]
MSNPSTLEALRAELDRIDAALIEHAAARQRLVSEIGRHKQQQGRQLRDYRREREVLDGVRARAINEGLEPDLAEALLKQLIEASLTRQEQQRIGGSGRGDGQAVLLIGGAGLMGQWLARFFDSQGFRVQIVDPAWSQDAGPFESVDDWRSACRRVDVVVVCTPIEISRQLLQDLIEVHREQSIDALVFDVASVKAPLVDTLRAGAEAGLNVCSIHPMFGPDTVLLAERHVVFMNVGQPAAVEQARALFEETMAEQV